MDDVFHAGNRQLQETFNATPMAERLSQTIIQDIIAPEDQQFIREQNMFFLATVDDQGRPNCSYKGGARGFVRIIDEHTVAFPSYDGNSMFMSMGNILVSPHVGLLFIDFDRQARLRLNGEASIDLNDPLRAECPEADLIVRVRVRQIFPNCPRYIHKMALVEESRFVPRSECKTPAPAWKSLAMVADVLSDKDKHLAGADDNPARAINRE